MNVIVDGLMTHYQKTGRGKILLMLHGWGDSAGTFSALSDKLKDSFQIVAVDLPGFGGSQAPAGLWGVADFADFVRQFLKKLELEPYALIGHSFGGAVSIELAAAKPAFGKLVLLASAGIRNQKPLRSHLLGAAAKTAKIPLYAMPSASRDRLKRKAYSSIGSDAMLLPHMEKIYRKIVAEDMRPAAQKVDLPTLLIYGKSDKSTPATDGLILHKLNKSSELLVIDAGHFLHQESVEEVAGLIKNFLGTKADV